MGTRSLVYFTCQRCLFVAFMAKPNIQLSMFRYGYIVPRTDVLVKRRFILNLTEEVFSQTSYKDLIQNLERCSNCEHVGVIKDSDGYIVGTDCDVERCVYE